MEDLKKYLKDVLDEEELIEIKGDALGKLASTSEERDKSWVYDKYFIIEPEEEVPKEESIEREEREEEEDPLKLFEDVPRPIEVSMPEVKAPKREFPLPKESRPPEHEEEISPKTRDLLRDVEEVNRLYDTTYITHNLDKVKSKYLQLLDKRNKLADKNPYILERLDKNLQQIKKRIGKVEKRKEDRKERKTYDAFINKLDRVLREYTKKYIAAHPEEVRREYLQLLDEKKDLGPGSPQSKEVIEKRIQRLRERIDSVEKSKELKKESIAIMKLANGILERAKKGNTEGVVSDYKNCVNRYESISKNVPKQVSERIKNKLSECKRVIQSLKKKRRTKKQVEEEKKSRATRHEVQGMKIYWNTYMKEVQNFKKNVEKARPHQYFQLYNKFNRLRDTYSNLVRRDVIPQAELQKARLELSKSFDSLEALKDEM